MHTLHHRTCIQSNRPNTGAPGSLGYLLCWPSAFLKLEVGQGHAQYTLLAEGKIRCIDFFQIGSKSFSSSSHSEIQ